MTQIILPLLLHLLFNVKSFRPGGRNAKKPHPLKLNFPFKKPIIQFVSDLNTRKRFCVNSTLPISIVPDRKIIKRKEIRQIFSEMETHKKRSELDVTVRYKNGIPLTVNFCHDTKVTIQANYNFNQTVLSKNKFGQIVRSSQVTVNM